MREGWIETPEDQLPPRRIPTNSRGTLLLREFLDAIRGQEKAKFIDFGFSDAKGFDGGLDIERVVFLDNTVYLILKRQYCTPWTKRTINFRQHLPLTTYHPKRAKPLEFAKALEQIATGGSDYVYAAMRRNYSPYGEHYVVPVSTIGPQVWTSGDKKHYVDWTAISVWADVPREDDDTRQPQ